jgi:hypothetical protein
MRPCECEQEVEVGVPLIDIAKSNKVPQLSVSYTATELSLDLFNAQQQKHTQR